MHKTNTAPLRINDLDPATFAATARTEPRHNARERQLIDAYRNGASIESLQRRSGYHPSQLWALLDLHRGTPEAEAQYQAAIRLYLHLKSITERDDEL